ncbi:GntR family transcriptional regulator [Roseibium sp.]|uniref:GntR family transcriptional regulator n=1 Tax=Roseibium sp. TaxID=1936156 RepID=UPI003BAAE998
MAAESFDNSENGGSGRGRTPARRAAKRSHLIFEDLQRDIMLGDLAPRQVILELDLADRFECSQSTIREALMFLDTDGLVERLPHRGTFVADCRADDAREMILIRRDIECRGVARVLERYGPYLQKKLETGLNNMREAAREGDEYLLSLHDRSFHLNLYEAADLPSTRPILRRCLIHNHRYKILNAGSSRGLMETADRHVAILDTLASGDEVAASEALSRHITTIVELGPDILAGPRDGVR